MRWNLRQADTAEPALAADGAGMLVEDFLESYVCWREASDAVRAAYERWRGGQSTDRGLAFVAYRATLDREEHAARMFRQRVDRVAGSSSSRT
jgi:hypothetical protein